MAIQNKQKICSNSIAEAEASLSHQKKKNSHNKIISHFRIFLYINWIFSKYSFFFCFIFISSQGIITSVHFCGEESASPPISIILTEIKEQSRDFFVDSLVKWGHFGYILSNGLLGVSFWSLSLSKHQLATSCLNCWGDGL